MAKIRTPDLAGIPLYYDRYSTDSYGVSARKFSPYVDEDFLVQCHSCFEEMQTVLSGHGFAITQIWSGGVGRDGMGSSYHHRNRAFDLDALIFADGKWVADTFPERPFLYLAIEAVLRKTFGTVLNYEYNSDHEDHFHFDNGQSVGFARRARSHALFVQNTLLRLFNLDIGSAGVDGVFGPDSEAALRKALRELGIGGLSDTDNWLAYLSASVDAALVAETGIVVVPDFEGV